MVDIYSDILEFHEALCPDQISEKPTIPPFKIQHLRKKLIREEYYELMRGLDQSNLERIADGGVDLIVVIIGTLIAYGIPFNEVWEEVHKTNMAKKDGPVREDGKRLKPVGWKPPNIRGILKNASLTKTKDDSSTVGESKENAELSDSSIILSDNNPPEPGHSNR